MIRRTLKWASLGALAAIPPGTYVLHKYRPHHSLDLEHHEGQPIADAVPRNAIEKALYSYMQFLVVGISSNLLKAILYSLYDIDFQDAPKLHDYCASERGGIPLVTVSNHVSVLDDPGMISIVTPPSVSLRPKRMRWTICTEEICFKTPNLAAFFGAGKAVPIQRGGSIYQKAMATLQHKLNEGGWVNIFSEGRVWQEQGLPLRDEHGRWCSAGGRCGLPFTKVGPMKWGVGKLVANSEKTPIVIPIFHTGFNDAMPQTYENQCETDLPFFKGPKITIQVGDPVPLRDLIDDYHSKAATRAISRNKHREAAINRELARMQPEESWFGWIFGWLLGGTAAPAKAAARHVASVDLTKIPINTVEETSDHTGESAHIAGLTHKASAEEVQQAAGAVPAEFQSPVTRVIATTAKEMSQKAMEAVSELETKAWETAKDVEEKAAATAREIEARAKELVQALADLRKKHGVATAEPPVHADSATAKVAAKARELLDDVERWGASVSVPAPPTVRVSSETDKGQQDSTSTEDSGPKRVNATADLADAPFPLSNDPVVEVVPTRVLRTGTRVPKYTEAPLRIKPPDHDYLTPEEAIEEENIRLELYSAITTRIHDGMVMTERKAMHHRRHVRGIPDSRPMETTLLPAGPSAEQLERNERDFILPYLSAAESTFTQAWKSLGSHAPGAPKLK